MTSVKHKVSNQTEQSECSSILAWVGDQNLPDDKAVELALPPHLSHASEDGKLHAARTRDGRLCVLLKKSIGWKGNFEGLLCCDSPLQQSELHETDTGLIYLSLPGLGIFEEIYIKNANSETAFEVYFDLN